MIKLERTSLYLLFASFVFSVGVYVFCVFVFNSSLIQIIRASQTYALTSLFFLYSALLATPLSRQFPFPRIKQYAQTKPTLIFLSCYFGLLHGCFAFFGQLGGFEGLFFLSNRYLFAISLSFTSLLLLFILSILLFKIISILKFDQIKFLYPVLYVIGMLILIHALLLGTHFQDLFAFVPQVVLSGLMLLFLLEARIFDEFLGKKFSLYPNLGLTTMIVFSGIVGLFIYFFAPMPNSEGGLSFGIHAAHIRLAKETQQNTTSNLSIKKFPGLDGDRTKRYTVSMDSPDKILPGQDVELTFSVFDAASGNKIELFKPLYEKLVHLIVVDKSLAFFSHIHPEQKGNTFVVKTSFPHEGSYHLYLDFQPYGAIEQQIAFSLMVGEEEKSVAKTQDARLTKQFGDYEVTLATKEPLTAAKMSIGEQPITFTVKDAQTKNPVTTLKPYLGAFGHLVMIRKDTFDYLHVHPTVLKAPLPNESGGPSVEFLPIGIYGAFKPGTYRVFAQFNPDDKLFTADFEVEIK